MDFYEVVGQVLALLQRQGRVSYRALKRQFGIDDDFIEDLKEELCFSHPVVDQRISHTDALFLPRAGAGGAGGKVRAVWQPVKRRGQC